MPDPPVLKDGSIRFSFKEAVEEIFRDFPKLKGNTAFSAPQEHVQIAPSLDLQRVLDEMTAQKPPLGENPADSFIGNAEAPHSAAWRSRTSSLQAVTYVAETVSLTGDSEQDKYFSLDHETGHLVTKHGYKVMRREDINSPGHEFPQQDKMEGAADGYAAIRQIQRFGGDLAGVKAVADFRSGPEVFEGKYTPYFTSLIIDKIRMTENAAQFLSLTPLETAAVADAFVDAYAIPGLSARVLGKLHRDFLAHFPGEQFEYYRMLRCEEKLTGISPENPAPLEHFADCVINDRGTGKQCKWPHSDDPYIFYYGARFLTPYLQKGAFPLPDGREIKLTGPFWDDIREKTKDYQNAIPDQPVLERFLENCRDVAQTPATGAGTTAARPSALPKIWD
jgi:hypothetical protein